MGRLNQKGQTMVEYILLLAVSVGLLLTFMQSNFFKRYFGTTGLLASRFKHDAEFGYRHAFINHQLPDAPRDNTDATSHASYYNNGSTRFFGPKDVYPKQ